MRHLRRIMLAIALAVSATMLIPIGPAHAQVYVYEKLTLCIPGWVEVEISGHTVWVWDDCATEREIYIPGEIAVPCWPDCGPWIDFFEEKIDWGWQLDYFEQWGVGLETLSKSHVTEDPDLAQKLRHQATQELLSAAELRNGVEVRLDGVAWIDLKSGELEGTNSDLLWGAGKDLLSGQQLMMKALDNPEAIAPAMKAYDSALARFQK